MRKMIEGFQRIVQKYRKRNQRKSGVRLIGIKSLECNFNAEKRTYNPHFHIIVNSREAAEILLEEWLIIWTSKWANKYAQHFRPVNDLESDLVEIIKYGSKIFTEPDLNKKCAVKSNAAIHAAALYDIFEAMKGLRLFDRFGFNLPDDIRRQPVGSRLIKDFHEWVFLPEWHDWHSTENELVLSAYVPTNELSHILENKVDTRLD